MRTVSVEEHQRFRRWMLDLTALCTLHLGASWADICGDIRPLCNAFEARQTPLAFVRYWSETYGPDWSE